jgi:hypothetical protein
MMRLAKRISYPQNYSIDGDARAVRALQNDRFRDRTVPVSGSRPS